MQMIVRMGGHFMCVETNIKWAVPYWKQRKLIHPSITWVITE